MTDAGDVRDSLVEALELELVGPRPSSPLEHERLGRPPSRWYLTGFIVPADAPVEQRMDDDDEPSDDLDGGVETEPDAGEGDEEKQTPSRRFFPSSIGLSVLVPGDTEFLQVTVSWGDYERAEDPDDPQKQRVIWVRKPCREVLSVVPTERSIHQVPHSRGLELHVIDREVPSVDGHALVPSGTRALSIFLVNQRTVVDGEESPHERRDEQYAFQVQLQIDCDTCFIERPDLHGRDSKDADERTADLQYRDLHEYAVGHGISPVATPYRSECTHVETTWIPSAYVHRVEAVGAQELSLAESALQLDGLGAATDPAAVQASLAPLVTAWRAFIASAPPKGLSAERAEVAKALCADARRASERLQRGLDALSDPTVFACFTAMNRTMAAAMRQRDTTYVDVGTTGKVPTWRPFQLAFILLNLVGLIDPTHVDRRQVDLLYFPTGGGKTEAYLGLAAFSLLLRRRRSPGRSGGGVGVLMRYTLRLLTLDQLERATTLICAMELERRRDPTLWGAWPFEIGLWVGQAATPNRIGDPKNPAPRSAVDRLRQFMNGGERPVPVERCSWCLNPLERVSGASPFDIVGTGGLGPRFLVRCVRRGSQVRGGPCPFSLEGGARQLGPGYLPLCLTDEEVYRRLPAFVIATVDKFASLPWVGASGALLGRVTHASEHGYWGPSDKHPQGDKVTVLPPDLVIQDELHLISGPLGTMVGLYETAIDALSERNGIRPKLIASTATVRRAVAQTRALFCREDTAVFPPPMPNRRELFFARTVIDPRAARRYLGVAAQGRSHKVVMLRVFLALLSASKKHWDDNGGPRRDNPADPYMTLLGYFNSLKELGNARRIVEDEVISRLRDYSQHVRLQGDPGHFADRVLSYEVEELTSRASTVKVSQTKAALALAHDHLPTGGDLKPVDVALATNMISVGLDITRLGLMVVYGQPKAAAEYIQATSRVGRDPRKPGLVVTLLNIHRPRDRSHYERFEVFHESFYRAVEATSVTPFSPRAMDRGLAAVTVALARHGWDALTPAKAVSLIQALRPQLDAVARTLDDRERRHVTTAVVPSAGARTKDVLDAWKTVVAHHKAHADLQYGREPEGDKARALLHTPLEEVEAEFEKFRARRSLRDVEATANLWVRTLSPSIDEEGES
jgi:hypothetical protein